MHACPDKLAKALIVLGSTVQQLELLYMIMALYREKPEKKLEELTERIGRELMEHDKECADL